MPTKRQVIPNNIGINNKYLCGLKLTTNERSIKNIINIGLVIVVNKAALARLNHISETKSVIGMKIISIKATAINI